MSRNKVLFAALAAVAAIGVHRGVRSFRAACHMQPAAPIETYTVERSAIIEAPPRAVLSRIADVRYWNDWFPREALDRKMQERISGPQGPGATYSWSGNESVGSGRVTIVSAGADRIEAEVKVERPAESLSDLQFLAVAEGTATRLTWKVQGEKDASGDAFGVYAVPAAEMGVQMENSLAELKALVEQEAAIAAR